jgi:hypothetical protein
MSESWISLGGVKWDVSMACLLVFLWVQNGETTIHHRNASPSVWYHHRCSRYWHTMLLVCVSQWKWDPLGTHRVMSKILYNCLQFTNAHTQFHWHRMNGPMSALVHSVLNLVMFSRLMTMRACPSRGMSIVHCLPVPTYGANWPPLSLIHMQHYRRHTSAYDFQQTDILLLRENESLPSGHLDGFSTFTPSLTLWPQRWTCRF